MKIAIGTCSLGRHGVARTIMEFHKRWEKNNEITIFLDKFKPEEVYEEFLKFNVISLDFPFMSFPLVRRYLLAYAWKNMNFSDFDVFLAMNFYCDFSALNNDNVCVYITSARLPIYDKKWSMKNGLLKFVDTYSYLPLKPFDIKAVKRAKGVVCPSFFVKEKIDRLYGIDSKAVHLGASVDNFYFKKFGDYCLYVGAMSPQKGVDRLVRIWSKVRDLKLVILGPGQPGYVQYLKSIANKNVIFMEKRVSEKELRELYANCFCFLFMAFEEDFGQAVIEAMASSKPVIARNDGALQEIVVNNKTGFLVSNDGEVAEKINLLLEDRNMLAEFGRNARKRAEEKFNFDLQTEELLKYIKNVL
jgi:glycosyltransferase involved in cell wall biosynthesis